MLNWEGAQKRLYTPNRQSKSKRDMQLDFFFEFFSHHASRKNAKTPRALDHSWRVRKLGASFWS